MYKNNINSKLIFSIIYIIIFSHQSFAQMDFDQPVKIIEPAKLIVNYSMEYQQDSLNSNFIKQEDMMLIIGENTSKYISYNYYHADSLTRGMSFSEFQKLVSDVDHPLPLVRFQTVFIKNYPIGEITCTDHIIGGSFKYEENLDVFDWELLPDTSTFKGFKVQKAICNYGGREWTAWFSKDIPFNDGPYKFNGLPGLILKIQDSKKHYFFEFTSIGEPWFSLNIDYVENDYIECTKFKFFQAQDEMRQDILSRAKDAGLSNDIQQKLIMKMAERNNPLELIRN
jgi:GLPGLI family protein